MATKKTTKRGAVAPEPAAASAPATAPAAAKPARRTRATISAEAATESVGSAVQVLSHEQTRSELVTAAVIGAAAVLIEIELLPGILLGVAAMMIPKLFPGVTNFARPLMKSTIGLGYRAMAKTQQLVAEASDHAQDMLAEIRVESERGGSARAK